MTRKINKAVDRCLSLRVNLVFSERRDRELFNELNKADVNTRAALLKHFCVLGMYSEKLAFAEQGATKPSRKRPSSDKSKSPPVEPEKLAEQDSIPAKPVVRSKEIELGEKCPREYTSNDLGGASDLGFGF